jgi:hypothetical protein
MLPTRMNASRRAVTRSGKAFMRVRPARSAPVAELGQVTVISRKRVLLIVSVPALSLLLPGLAVEVASSGGAGEFTRATADVARFLLFYSGVFALVALSAAVAAGLLATDRIVLTPERRILAQALHRTCSLIGISALANHIMLEILASRARIVDGFVPFLASRNTVYMGLGTLSSDLFVLVIVTGVLRRRFTSGARRALWRGLHLTAYAAWPMGVLHGLLAGRSAKPYVDWSYGACLTAVAVALTVRYVMLHRGRTVGPAGQPGRTAAPLPAPTTLPGATLSGPLPPGALPRLSRRDALRPGQPADLARAAARAAAAAAAQPTFPPGRRQPARRALPGPAPREPRPDRLPRPPRRPGAPWSGPQPANPADRNAWIADEDAWTPDQDAWTAPPAGGWE